MLNVVKSNRSKMKIEYIIVGLLFIVFSSFNNKITTKKNYQKRIVSSKNQNSEGLKLLQQNCYACHSVSTKSHNEIIAPPMAAVKRSYRKEYDSKDDFVKAFVAYASNPKAENALMIGAVNKFKAMPKQAFKSDDLRKIAIYVYDNEIETPEWFEDHFQQNHKNGQGMGRNKIQNK